MSVKRQATSDLNHENWDKEDPADHEDMGIFKTAPKEEIEKRVMRTAKRRSLNPAGSDAKKPVFSNFGGFNKAAPSSFDFLANLTNGSKSNGNETPKSQNNVTTSLFSSKPLASSTFQMTVSSPSTMTSTGFGVHAQTNSLFGSSTNTPSSANKPESTAAANSPSKTSSTSTTTANITGFTFKTSTVTSNTSTPNVSPSIFGMKPASAANSLFSSTNSDDKKPASNDTKILPAFGSNTLSAKTPNKNTDLKSCNENNDPNKLKFYSKLKCLNNSVLEWISKHVNETPLCILTPIFNDYTKHLKEIQDEYENSKQSKKVRDASSNAAGTDTSASAKSPIPNAAALFSAFKGNNTINSENKPLSAFSPSNNTFTAAASSLGTPNPSGFSFGINKSSENTSPFGLKATESSTTFGAKVTETSSPFGAKNSEISSPFGGKATESSSPFGAKATETSSKLSTTGAAPFSFGMGQPFSFSPNTQNSVKSADTEKKDENEDDEPPKVEYTPVVEENSVFDKKCKIFVKKGDTYADKGVGTLYLKKLETGKHQLLVRANTSLGNVILNFILSSDLPTQRMGKNNVMVVCIPTPGAAPPPVPTLIRVKTSEEADELLEVLNKHKA